MQAQTCGAYYSLEGGMSLIVLEWTYSLSLHRFHVTLTYKLTTYRRGVRTEPHPPVTTELDGFIGTFGDMIVLGSAANVPLRSLYSMQLNG